MTKQTTVTINAERAFELMYELFKEKPWLNSPGVMTEQDHHAEHEAVVFLLNVGNAPNWDGCSEAASRVVCTLLLDFIAKLHGQLSGCTWHVPNHLPKWQQAARIIADEILRSFPELSKRH